MYPDSFCSQFACQVLCSNHTTVLQTMRTRNDTNIIGPANTDRVELFYYECINSLVNYYTNDACGVRSKCYAKITFDCVRACVRACVHACMRDVVDTNVCYCISCSMCLLLSFVPKNFTRWYHNLIVLLSGLLCRCGSNAGI